MKTRTVTTFTITAGRLRALLAPLEGEPASTLLQFEMDGTDIAVAAVARVEELSLPDESRRARRRARRSA